MIERSHIATFGAVADALLPRLDGREGTVWTSAASDLGLPDRLPTVFALLPGESERRDLVRLLRLLELRAGGLLLYGMPRAFADLTPAQAEAALRTMASSRLPAARQAFQVLKRIAGFLLTTPSPAGACAFWEDTGYPGPDGEPPDNPKRISVTTVPAAAEWTADVVVIGSGAGGGTAAAVLAAAGLDVVVLEKGRYLNEADFTHDEAEAYRDLYLDAGFGTTADLAIGMLAGSNLGGGTTVNWTTSFATPPRVREQWDRESGLPGVFTGPEFEAAAAAVHDRLGINTDNNHPSSTDALMAKGLSKLGWHVDAMPRNVADCGPAACGYCGFGCRTGAKRGTLRTFLEDAHGAGARIVTEADVERVTIEEGRATGVVASVAGVPLSIAAKAIVVAAGALHTPAVLMRSGVRFGAVGRYLRLHPVTVVWGRFADRVEPWTGILQSLYSDEFADLDGEGYGFKFETGPVHPVFPAMFFGWDGGRRYKELLLDFPHWSPIGVLLRDRDSGRVKVDRHGRATWHYRLSRRDTGHMKTGVARAAELLAEAGAVEVLASSARGVTWSPGSERRDAFLSRVGAAGYGPNRMAYLSFHQMGSARMGVHRRRSAVDGDNRVHGVAGLYVMDGSCFPTASGVNPMTSIQTIAHRGATLLAQRLAG